MRVCVHMLEYVCLCGALKNIQVDQIYCSAIYQKRGGRYCHSRLYFCSYSVFSYSYASEFDESLDVERSVTYGSCVIFEPIKTKYLFDVKITERLR